MKGPTPQAVPGQARELLNSAEHLSRRLIGERDQKDSRRRNALFKELRYSVRECPGFAGPSTCDDYLWPSATGNDSQLLFVEIYFVIDLKTGGSPPGKDKAAHHPLKLNTLAI